MKPHRDVVLYKWVEGEWFPVADEFQPFLFSGGEPHINLTGDFVVGSQFMVRVYGGSFDAIGTALVVYDALYEYNAGSIHLFLPYVPAARQDRGTPATLEIVLETLLISNNGWSSLTIVDPHSDRTKEILHSCHVDFTVIEAADLIPDELFSYKTTVGCRPKTFSVIAPDAGAMNRAKAVAERFNVPLVVADKKRDPDNNFRVMDYTCPQPETDYAVVVDDICDGGGTFLALANAINMPSDRLRLWTTHGIYSKGTDVLYPPYSMVASTDSVRHTSSIHITVPLLPHYSSLVKGSL